MSQYMLHSIQAIISLIWLVIALIILFLLLFSMLWLRRNFEDLAKAISPRSLKYDLYQDTALRDDIIKEISFSESRFGFRLSPEAKQLFVSPIIEAYQNRRESSAGEFDETWRYSINLVLGTIAEELRIDPFRFEYYNSQRLPMVSAIDVLNAFRIRWCNIPPFCKPV